MKALTKAELQTRAPAVFSVGRDETRTSDRYAPMSTLDAIGFLKNEGYSVTDANQMFARKKDNAFTRHVVMLTHADHMKAEGKLDVIPRIMLFNSHNGTTALKLQAGFFRFVCANGLIVGDQVFQSRLRHSAPSVDVLNEQLQHVAGVARESGDLIERWKAKKLTTGAMDAFAREALKIRVRGEPNDYDTKLVLEAKRDEDDSNDLWSVFNRVQENLVKGGVSGARESGRVVTLRPLNNIRRNTEFNQGLWNLASAVYDAKPKRKAA